MDYEIILENEWGVVRYEPEHKYIYHTFFKDVNGKDVQHILNVGLETLEKYGAIKWLSDDRKNGPIWQEDIDFSLNDWGPRAAAAGWKYWALVVPDEVIGRASMIDVVDAYFQLGVRVQTFTDLETAKKWLLKF